MEMNAEMQEMLHMQRQFGFVTLITRADIIDDVEGSYNSKPYVFEPGEPRMVPVEVANHLLEKVVDLIGDETGETIGKKPRLEVFQAAEKEEYPKAGWKKAKMLLYCNENDIDVKPRWSREQIWESIEMFRSQARQGNIQMSGVPSSGPKATNTTSTPVRRGHKRK